METPTQSTQGFVQSTDLAQILKGQSGRYVAATPSGDILVADAKPGHSITGLRLVPRAQGSLFNVAKVAELKTGQGTERSERISRGEGQGEEVDQSQPQLIPVA